MIKTNPALAIVPPAGGATNSARADIRDLRDPVKIPDSWAWLPWAAGVGLLLLLGWMIWRRWRQRQTTPTAARPVPAHERALENLREALRLLDHPRPFCTAVSDVLRQYLEERFDLRAPDRTTDEFLEELRTSRVLNDHQKQTLAHFLSHCDLVKFARYEPPREELEALHNSAVRLVEETEPAPVNASPPDPSAASLSTPGSTTQIKA